MLLDARDSNVGLNRETQVLIVGAGPAGLTLAHELARVADVLLIESGGFDASPVTDQLNAGKTVGLSYPLQETRTRRVGGSLSLWAGWLTPFEPHDFVKRDRVPQSGWPFGINTLEPFFAKSAERLNLKDLNFDAGDLAAACDIPLALDNAIIRPTVWRFGTPTLRFSEAEQSALAVSRRLTLLTHANAVNLKLDSENGSITDVTIRTLEGREGSVSAEIVVIACGGLETARLLLNADRQHPEGVANSSDLLGRCFMEHPHFTFESLELRRPELFIGSSAPQRDERGREFMLNFGLTPEVQISAGILNGRVHVFRTPAMGPHDLPRVGLFMEQAANRASRLTLGQRCDGLGLRELVLDWQLCEQDWSTYRQTRDLFIEAFELSGTGRRLSASVDHRAQTDILHSNHHLGTTRMAKRKEDGVVNEDCRCHDVDNLYLIGGNVFPTVSWANPTFTLMAMTYRLADHLRVRFKA